MLLSIEKAEFNSAFLKQKTKRYLYKVLVSLVNYWEKKERVLHALFYCLNPMFKGVLKAFAFMII